METNESPEQALTRELEEELGVHRAIGQEITSYEFSYPGKHPIRLMFFRVTAFDGEPANLIFEEMHWEIPERFPDIDFVEGDKRFIQGWGSYTSA